MAWLLQGRGLQSFDFRVEGFWSRACFDLGASDVWVRGCADLPNM